MIQPNSTPFPQKLAILLALGVLTLICMLNIYGIRQPNGDRTYLFIRWDTFLAWVPVWIALKLDFVYLMKNRTTRFVLLLLLGAIWLFFYPNSSYLVTELLHVFVRYSFDPAQRFWVNMEFWEHLLTLTSIAILGLLLAAYSLYTVQELVRRSYGLLVSWIFALLVLMLSSFGVYIGRFVRWNSWDVMTRPGYIIGQTYEMLTDSSQLGPIMMFCKYFFIVLLLGYIPIYLMTRIRRES
ncbi:DUF1361 domain-containing protein [Paenibacillus sp. YYML68]|uniref:DUF1361 domain-containing protein n=1 Tax=Paenibacillus sp. YYML68 TaxID=2909250 RepID=UPI002492CFF6|nr:DUF1361 domain-containing protein [Paenibacillus sp. YYML68]